MMLSFTDFRLVGLAFELRYPDAFLLWDRAGQLAGQLQARYPVTRLTSAEPGKVVFLCDRTKEISWHLDRLIVIDHRPGSAKPERFYDLCEQCFELTAEHLQIEELKRAGFRLTFAKVFPTKEDAGDALVAAGILRIPHGKQFNIDAPHTLPEYAIRREGEKFGFLLRISIQSVKFEFEPPPQWEITEVPSKEEHRLVFDLDWYTIGAMPVGSMKVSEWLSQIIHAVHRDADAYFGAD
jgi:hypothetical protein